MSGLMGMNNIDGEITQLDGEKLLKYLCQMDMRDRTEIVYVLESDYENKKLELSLNKSKLLLTTNWNRINTERVNKGLSKISNEKMRESYIKLKLEGMERELLKIEALYHAATNFLKKGEDWGEYV